MFEDSGSKLKTVGTVTGVVGIAASVIGGIAAMARISFLYGLLILLAGALCAWISALSLCAFGELVEQSNRHSRQLDTLIDLAKARGAAQPTAPAAFTPAPAAPRVGTPTRTDWVCKKCGTKNPANSLYCRDCGEYR